MVGDADVLVILQVRVAGRLVFDPDTAKKK